MLQTGQVRWVPVLVAARELKVSRQRVRQLIRNGGLAAEFVGSQWLVSVGSVESRIAKLRKDGDLDAGCR
jgi:excisionase family DNA binding protein